MSKALAWIAAVFAVPVLTLAGFGLAGARPDLLPPGGRLLSLAGTVTAAYACVFAFCVLLLDRRLQRRERDLAGFRGRESDLLRRIQDLRARVDTLSAAREVCLILNQDVDFRMILEKVLGITADLLGGKGSEEITIYLRSEDNGHLVPRARRRPFDASVPVPGQGEPVVAFDFEGDEALPGLVSAAYEHGRLITAAGEARLEVALPLVADREIFGVLLARAPLDGEREEKAERAQRTAGHLEEFAKFVALAIKTPDLYTRAVEDGLTKLSTKRHFRHQLELHTSLARRHGEPLALILIDIDHFKAINDTHGHLTGDAVLRGVAEIILGNLRRTDEAAYSAYRFGGEEMSVILPKTDTARASDVAERLRRQVEARRFEGSDRETVRLTISCGVASLTPDMKGIDDLIGAADRSLYEAKEGGRNQVRVAGAEARDRKARPTARARA